MIDEYDNSTLELFESAAQSLKREIDEDTEKLKALEFIIRMNTEKLRESVCNHDVLIERSEYFPGSYLDTDYTVYKYVCELCGKVVDSKQISHGSYG